MTEVTPERIAEAVNAALLAAGRAPDMNPPTPEQRAIIRSPQQPALVVAGAGSGKTETMAFRALWLIANGRARPAEILGLTFTKKAAGELAKRMRRRVEALRAAGLVPAGDEDPAAELLDAPQVSTYNSFATALFRDNAALLGQDPDAVVLGEAAAWLLAREVVAESTDLRLADADRRIDTLASDVLGLASALADNDADPVAVARMAEEFARLGDLPPGGRGEYPEVAEWAGRLAQLPALLDAAAEFRRRKLERGYLQFSDQVVSALHLAQRAPRVGAQLREQYRVVILDEYQDTSVGQTALLAELFRGHSVMAVGDPNQAIYGWRGASADNLGDFGRAFDGTAVYSLATSWRNPVPVLAAANRLVEPLREASPVPVAELQPKPGAGADPIAIAFEDDITAEAASVARWFRTHLTGGRDAALLLRARTHLDRFTAALSAEGVPFHVLGAGGLLAQPVIADLVAALRVVADPTAGEPLIRLLAGSRWRIGAADIAALAGLARWLSRVDAAQQPLDDAAREGLRRSVSAEEGYSIVDALDFLAVAREGHGMLGRFSEVGLARLREAGAAFARLRRHRGELADLVQFALELLDLDVDAAANEARDSAAALEAFHDALAQFVSLGRSASLRSFLGWLEEAQRRDRLSPRSDPPESGVVQILTIHGAKGLEWDLVAVPRLTASEFPGTVKSSLGWLSFGALPYEFRGDRDSLPALDWRGQATRKEVRDAVNAYKEQVKHRELEEQRRLGYVAVTRTKERLLLSGSWWDKPGQTKPDAPSEYLDALADAGLLPPLPEAAPDNPMPDDVAFEWWPRDPLGGRRARVEAAAAAVRAADPAELGRWRHDVELLLAERALGGPAPAGLPARISASRFKDYLADGAGVAAQLRRPVPERPYRATRLGTVFHAWVEHRADPAAPGVELDEDLAEAPELVAIDEARFAELKETFLASPWGRRRPIEVEREIHLPWEGRTMVCKIDAVFQDGDRYEIVDWKTGAAPTTEAEIAEKRLQLALYRLAYARWSGVPLERIDVALYYVAEDRVIRPDRVESEEELLARWHAAQGI